ncbi:DUF6046 domain-containing protein [Arcicella sp. LKC2W]|uniref:DUF6046 domain-containing protein n=1 Tax=Arcicella sp. LKC2W TaxID=2984198 RepID=UPI002B200F5D|nr:DUF6046 domain-containing protein [Arcicella sp. LKC2W]MEA5461552.1 DUF6046 domain-containing protein [Arcicella sp. LKC2W]
MALIDVALADLYKNVFGFTGEIQKKLSGEAEGRTIRCPVTMSYDGDDVFNPDSWTIPFEPIVSVHGKNVIIRNPVLKNRDIGTVKELWSADDWQVEIKGIVYVDDTTKLPQADINRLRYFFEVRRAIKVESPFLSLFGINYLAIESVEFPPTDGYNYQAFVYKCYSDKPFNL